jgi:hypothetical protein
MFRKSMAGTVLAELQIAKPSFTTEHCERPAVANGHSPQPHFDSIPISD